MPETPDVIPSAALPPRLRVTAWIVITTIAALQAVVHRQSMNPDGLSYLDSARAFLAGDLAAALNPHWGPLYPAAVALGFAIIKPGIEATIPVVHAVTWVCFLVAFAAFEFFLRELLRGRQNVTSAAIFGYTVFAYAALVLTGMTVVTPDLLVMASVFAAAGLILRMRRDGATLRAAVLLGTVLAIGYFAKSVLFVLGVVFIGSLVFLPAARGGRPWRAIATALAVFIALSSLLIVPISRRTGTPTFGTAGKLAYNWEVNRVPYVNWQGDKQSRLAHPPRQVRSNPDLFEYTGHLQGTYPPWSDPAYWNTGTVVPIRPWQQMLQLYHSTQFYVDLFLGSAAVLATLVAVLALSRQLGGYWAVLLPALAGLGIYTPVHIEPRYVAPFAVLLWIIPLAVARPSSAERARLLDRTARVAAALLALPIAFLLISGLWKRRDSTKSPFPIVARELHRLGLGPGDRVVNVGSVSGENFGASFEGYWAYLAGVHIAAEIPEQKDFLCREPAVTEEVFSQMAALGARAAVTRGIPVTACMTGWLPVQGTNFYVHLLPPTGDPLPDPK